MSYDSNIYVPPDGPEGPAHYAVAGEAPAQEEARRGRGFVGPSGRLLWPPLRRLAGLERGDCWVTNLCKHPLDNDRDGETKMSPEEFEACTVELETELLEHVEPGGRILAVGALVAKALLGDRYTSMEVCNGMRYYWGNRWVIPCWHPAAALRPSGEGKDPLAWMGDAMLSMRGAPSHGQQHELSIPPPEFRLPSGVLPFIAIDTEGTPDDPFCLTWSEGVGRYYVHPQNVPLFVSWVQTARPVSIYHNAPWDWKVIDAMMRMYGDWGPRQSVADFSFRDTMELAYLRQTEPQALKKLAERHFGLKTPDFLHVVNPVRDELILGTGQGLLDTMTKTTTHSPKTGKPYKKPKVEIAAAGKPLKRALNNPELMAKRLVELGVELPQLSLRIVPFETAVEYATLDPFLTYKVWEVLG